MKIHYTAQKKDILRKQVKESFLLEYHTEYAQKLCASLKFFSPFKEASCVGIYAPLSDEIDCLPLLSLFPEKQFVFPRIEENTLFFYEILKLSELRKGCYGILEPEEDALCVPDCKLDMVIVPGCAFTHKNERLGRGRGFYDRLLSRLRQLDTPPFFLGIAHPSQMVSSVYPEKHDEPLDKIFFLS
jgi:5-formyltetrahydrofolate cyclo-ligase